MRSSAILAKYLRTHIILLHLGAKRDGVQRVHSIHLIQATTHGLYILISGSVVGYDGLFI